VARWSEIVTSTLMFTGCPANSRLGAITAGGAKAAWFKDSEGNIMALIQTLSKG